MVSPLGHGGADSSSRASLPTRAAWASSSRPSTNSQPAVAYCPRAAGYERIWVSPSPIADAADACSGLADALVDAVTLARHEPLARLPDAVRRRPRCRRRARDRLRCSERGDRPCRTAARRTRRSRTGSPRCPSPARDGIIGGPGRLTRPLASAISAAVSPARGARRRRGRASRRNPNPEPTSARTPMPESASSVMDSMSPLRASIDSWRRRITRASA